MGVSRRATVVLTGVAMFAASLTGVPGGYADDQPPPTPDAEPDMFAAPTRLSEAIGQLPVSGTSEVARRNKVDNSELRRHGVDKSAWLDRKGRLFYADPAAAPAAIAAAAASPLAVAPYSETFLLHSRPGAARTIYLDFNGHAVAGTAWNSSFTSGAAFTAEPYDTDGVPGTFANTEMDVVQEVWRRVSEDYAAFDVDVTTQEPGIDAITRSSSTDNVFGTRLIISPTNTIYASCGCGGIAYVGVIDSTGSTHSYYQPAFVFTRGVGNGAKNITEAASHEVGHNLGLGHDGTSTLGYYSGHGAWAPIMGVGYNKPISQWSRGEYVGANNTQDDIAVMRTHLLLERADDFGSVTSPTALTGQSISVNGVISSRTDVDAFSVAAGAGPATFTVVGAPNGANLDARLELRDSAGTVIASNDPASALVNASVASGLGATITTTLAAAGTYTVSIDGVGFADPLTTGYSDYGSFGQYSLTGTVSAVGTTNLAPTARAAVTLSSTTAPSTATYSSAGSSDPDGTISSYLWTFGDGTTSTLANPTKLYSAAGTYSATLRVTDNAGATGSASVSVVVNPPVVTKTVRVQSLTMTTSRQSGRTTARVVVVITNPSGVVQSGVRVTGAFSGAAASTVSGTTGSNGSVTLTSSSTRSTSGTFTFKVSALSKSGWVYDATKNLVTTVSKSF